MTSGELAYLVMVIVGTLLFAITLAWVSRGEQGPHRAARSRAHQRNGAALPPHGGSGVTGT